MSAVQTGLSFVGYPGNKAGCGCGCDCGCPDNPPIIYRSVWDRLVQQMFGPTPIGMNSEEQFQDVRIWKDGVEMVGDSYPYTFTVPSDAGDTPHPDDVVFYEGKYYVIGAVDE